MKAANKKRECKDCKQSLTLDDYGKKEHRRNNIEKYREIARNRSKKRWKDDPDFRIIVCLRNRLRKVLLSHGAKKADHTKNLLGCTWQKFKDHIEEKFEKGMTWDNYGIHGWHIDHIKPCAAFDLTDPEQQKKCFNYINLQPLWEKDNFSKNSRYNGKRFFVKKQK